mmetsp:Transcript_43576/g.125790  ORF Transcript_43576/g.125790 Transcript_43576/m.125790 type:complete len:238 (-) Transcript_43576:57-770(-)
MRLALPLLFLAAHSTLSKQQDRAVVCRWRKSREPSATRGSNEPRQLSFLSDGGEAVDRDTTQQGSMFPRPLQRCCQGVAPGDATLACKGGLTHSVLEHIWRLTNKLPSGPAGNNVLRGDNVRPVADRAHHLRCPSEGIRNQVRDLWRPFLYHCGSEIKQDSLLPAAQLQAGRREAHSPAGRGRSSASRCTGPPCVREVATTPRKAWFALHNHLLLGNTASNTLSSGRFTLWFLRLRL